MYAFSRMPSKTRKQKQRNQRGGGPPIDGRTERYTPLFGYKGVNAPHIPMDTSVGIATANKRYFDHAVLASSIIPQKYIPESDIYKTVTTFKQLKDYIDNFLRNNPPYGTILHTGPLNKESEYIQKILLEINDAGFIPLDSQIGAVVSNRTTGEITLNRPYIELLMPVAEVGMLRGYLMPHPKLCEVRYPNEAPTTLAKFTGFIGAAEYETVYIGLQPPTTEADVAYILDARNRFFMELQLLLGMIMASRGAKGGKRRSRSRKNRRCLH